MRDKNKKSKSITFSAHEYTAMSEYLEKMAEEGWLLEKINGSSFKFRKTEPKSLKFEIVIIPDNRNFAFFTDECTDSIQDTNWTYICETPKYLVFFTEDLSSTFPTGLDQDLIYDTVIKASSKELLSKSLTCFIMGLNIFNLLFLVNITQSLSSNLSLLIILVSAVLMITSMTDIINTVFWLISSKIRKHGGTPISFNTFKQVKIKNMVSNICSGSVIVLFLLILLFDKNKSPHVYIVGISLLALILIIIGFNKITEKFLDKKDYSQETKSTIHIGSTIISVVLVMLVTMIAADYSIKVPKNNAITTIEDFPLTLNNLGFENNEITRLHIETSQSVISKETIYDINANTDGLYYTVFESDYPLIIKIAEKLTLRNIEKYMVNSSESISVNYYPSMDNLKVNAPSYGRHFIMVSDNKIVNINNFLGDFTDEDFIKIVYDNIFKGN